MIHNGTEWKGLAYVDELGISWGDIQGSLLDQTDLVSVLNDKASIDQPVFNGEVGIIGNLHFKNNGNKIFGGNSRSNFIEMYDSQTGGINLRTLNGTSPVNIEGGLIITGQFTTDESIKLDRGKAFEGVNNSSFLPYDSANGNMVLTPSTLGSYGKIRFNYGPNSLEGFRLTHLGDVGIGTTSPSTKLDVNGVAKATEFKTTNTGITFNEGGSQYGIIRNSGSGFLTFRGLQSGASGYQFFVNNTTEVLNISNDGTITGISFVGDGSLLTDLDYNNISNTPTLFSGDYNDLSNKPDLSVLNDTIVEPTINNFPATGLVDSVYIAEDTGYMYRWNGSSYTQLTDQTAIWGEISGTLSNQTDLQNALDGKANNLDVFSGNYNDLSNKPNLSIYVDKSSNETIGGFKTFSTGFQDNNTNIGRNTSPYVDITSGNWSGRIGQSRFYNGTSDLSPDNGAGWWTITGKRDWANGYAGIFIDYGNGKLSSGYNKQGGDPIWATMIDDKHDQTIGGEKTFTSNSIFNGKVGIGINPPLAKLDVNGATVFRTTDNYNVGPNVLRVNGLGMLGNRSSMYLTNRNPTGNIKFGVGGVHGTASEKMILTSTGDLGIGTTSPSTKLDVNGNIRIDHLKLGEFKSVGGNSVRYFKIGYFTLPNQYMDGQAIVEVLTRHGGNHTVHLNIERGSNQIDKIRTFFVKGSTYAETYYLYRTSANVAELWVKSTQPQDSLQIGIRNHSSDFTPDVS